MSAAHLLAGVKVVEIADGVCGPVAGRILVDLGAEVTKIERPPGDWLMDLDPDDGNGKAVYQQLNLGKNVIRLDLATGLGKEQLSDLALGADIFLVGHPERQLSERGISVNQISSINPSVVYCLVSGWGSDGPLAKAPASELSVQAVAGFARYLGRAGHDPIRQGFDLVSVNTGMSAVQAILASMVWRESSGVGQFTEVSMLSTAVALMQWNIAAESGPDEWDGRQLNAQHRRPDHGFQCADARFLINFGFVGREKAWSDFLRDIGRGDLADDPRFTTTEALDAHEHELPGLTAGSLSAWSFQELEKLVRERYKGTIVPVLTLPEVIKHEQMPVLGVLDDSGDHPRLRFPLNVRNMT